MLQRRLSLPRFDLGSHVGERPDDAFHWTARERFIADHLASEVLTGNDAAQHAHGGTGIAAIKRDLRGIEGQTSSFHLDNVLPFRLAFPTYAQSRACSRECWRSRRRSNNFPGGRGRPRFRRAWRSGGK